MERMAKKAVHESKKIRIEGNIGKDTLPNPMARRNLLGPPVIKKRVGDEPLMKRVGFCLMEID